MQDICCSENQERGGKIGKEEMAGDGRVAKVQNTALHLGPVRPREPLWILFFGGQVLLKTWITETSLGVQGLSTCLPTQGTQVPSLVRKDSTRRGASQPLSHSYWTYALEPHAPGGERRPQCEAHAPRQSVDAPPRSWREPRCLDREPAQPERK